MILPINLEALHPDTFSHGAISPCLDPPVVSCLLWLEALWGWDCPFCSLFVQRVTQWGPGS